MRSIQAHPTKAQAEAGFARENAAGVPLTAPNRNYRDDNHKPEALVAVTEFWMLHGFRRVDEILEALTARPALRPLLPWVDRRSDDSPSGPAALQRLYEGVMMMPQPEVDALLEPLLVEIVPRYEAGAIGKSSPDFWAARAALDFAQPDGHRDRGILSIYLLNLVRVPAGCGAFVGPGLLHAHLSGVAIEIMASSDNVLRGGLTTKHVDVPELLRILRFDATPPHLIEAVAVSPSEQVYPVPAAEFALSRIGLGPEATSERVPAEGPDSLLVLEGAVRLRSGSQELAFARGGIAFVPAGRPYVLSTQGGAVVFSASVPAAGGSPSAAGR
jgi:mannose-6-phosphate isomerase